MRMLLALTLAMVLLSIPAHGSEQAVYSTAVASDEGIHTYFSSILTDIENVLEKVAKEDGAALNLSLKVLERLRVVDEEARFYEMHGVESNVSVVVGPFLELSESAYWLAKAQNSFISNMVVLTRGNQNATAVADARNALTQMRAALAELNRSTTMVEHLQLWNGTANVGFDTSNIRRSISDILGLVDYYEKLLERFEGDGLFVSVSKQNPVLFEEIEIYVYSRNVTPENLIIDGHEIPISENPTVYFFNETGEHTVYATGMRDVERVVSNTVTLNVGKIPTRIVIKSDDTAFIGDVVNVRGYIYDYYGSPLNTTLTVEFGNVTEILNTSSGWFAFNVSSIEEGVVSVTVSYAGDETHDSASARLDILFLRFPVTISLNANRTVVNVNETVLFTGKLTGAGEIPLSVRVNSIVVREILAERNFSFTLSFDRPGVYAVSVAYAGNETLRPAASNVVSITVKPSTISTTAGPSVISIIANSAEKNDLWLAAAVVTVIATLVAAIILLRKGMVGEKGEPGIMSHGGNAVAEGVDELSDGEDPGSLSIENAYAILFNRLAKKYGFKRGMTPREVLTAMTGAPFAEKLKRITEIHEILAYGGTALDNATEREYLQLVREVLEVVR